MPISDLDVFTDEQDVETPTSGPGWLRVVLVLIGAGLLFGIVVVIIAAVVSAGQPTATPAGSGGTAVCDGETSCSNLSLQRIEELTALDLPEGTEVIASKYEETEDAIVVEARVTLPDGAQNPFDDSAYFEVESVGTSFPAGIIPIAYYAATGELGALNADAVLGTGDDGSEVVAVYLRRDL